MALSSGPGPSLASVLVVDDAEANRIALCAVLAPLGVRLVEASSGRAALDCVERETFAVALLDVQMPEMDGFEVARRLRQTTHGLELPIIFLTAIHRDEEYARRGYESGAADYITKPFDPDVVRARVKAFVDLFQQRERLRAVEVAERTRERDAAYGQLKALLASERTARQQAEFANRAKDEFLATVSHELRTPLSAILGWAAIARRHGPAPEVDRALATIERNARAQRRLIEDVLDVGRIVGNKLDLRLRPTRVADVVESAVLAVRPAADAKGVALESRVAAAGTVFADPERLEQVFSNVLTNAVKFTPRGGHVNVSLEKRDETLVLRVVDDGEGIAPEFLPHLFETFRQADGSATRQHGGLGLGLAIADHLIRAHGGSVSAYSDGLGRGSTFVVELPTVGAPGSSPRSAPPPSAVRGRESHSDPPEALGLEGCHVLVVDDDEDGRDLLRVMLEDLGAAVICASSAEEALKLMVDMVPDVLVSDIGMPGVSGYDLIQEIRRRPRDRGGKVPALALTAYARAEDARRAQEAGFQAHLSKPIDPDRLTRLVADLARRRL